MDFQRDDRSDEILARRAQEDAMRRAMEEAYNQCSPGPEPSTTIGYSQPEHPYWNGAGLAGATNKVHRCVHDRHFFECKHETACECGETVRVTMRPGL